MAERPRIGWVGTGVMGGPICGHLLAAGYPVAVHNRTAQRAAPLLEQGADWCDSPAAVAAAADGVVCTMLGYPADLREVVLGPGGLLAELGEGALLVDLTTSEPALARELHAAGAERGVETLDAPVSGGDVGAREGTLTAMVGGSAAAFERARPILEAFCARTLLEGGPGAGQDAKMANQIAIAGGMVGICEALLYGYRSGQDPERLLETIAGGAAASWSLSNLAPRMLRGDLEPGFKIEHFVKDLGIALAEARRMELRLPGLELAERLYRAAREEGLGERGTQALIASLARASGLAWEPPTGA